MRSLDPPKSRICRKCKIERPLEEFALNSECRFGRTWECEECHGTRKRATARAYHLAHAEKINSRQRAWGAANREEQRDRCREYRVRRPDVHRRAISKHNRRHPERLRARYALRNAVKAGKIQKPGVCQDCGIESQIIHGHHNDYEKLLEVEWLCPQCHSDRHRKER